MSTAGNKISINKSPEGADSPVRFVAAPFTPMDRNGKVRLDRIPKTAKFLASQGVTGVFICGTTGEGMSMTLAERRAATEAWMAAGSGRLEVITHVGHQCVADARDLAAHAERCGVDAIASIGPTFYEAVSPASLSDYCLRIASAAPTRKFYYYHMPSMARVNFPASKVLSLMRDNIPTFAGIKFTHEDIGDYRRCVKMANGRHEIFFGRDELFLEGLKAGARSVVGSTYNFAMPLYLAIARAYAEKDFNRAEEIQKIVTDGITRMVRAGGLPAIKAMMSLVSGIDCGIVRPPLVSVSSGKAALLGRNLAKAGFLSTPNTQL